MRTPSLRRATAAAALALLAAMPAAEASVQRAETVLPPGQSGHVSVTGVTSGTGSPHLTDQISLFTHFRYKNALMRQPGRTEVPRAGVTVVRGPYGVPAVTGSTDYNAWWGIGYAVAQDRLFQLELFRRAGAGRLAEILGDGYLEDDLIARRDYYTDAELDAMLAGIPASLRRRAEAYRDGINAWSAKVKSDPSKLPGEFAALNVQPPTWTLRDTARVGILLARTVPSGDGPEIPNARALRELGPRAFAKLLPLRPKGRVPTVPRAHGLFPSQPGRTRRQEKRAFRRSQAFVKGLTLPSAKSSSASSSRALGGSYMWAIGRPAKKLKCKQPRRGRKCKPRYRRPKGPGKAFHFNGPQLGYSAPELFVEWELHSPVQNMRGVSAAGVPVLGIGHNGRVAWGFTSGLSDEDDLYAEKLTGPETYTYKGAQRRMECRNERFDYRAPPTDLPDIITDPLNLSSNLSGSKTERICRTVHGPVQARARGVAYARRYAIWKRELETIVGLTALNDAGSVRDVDRAMLNVTWNENVIAADSRGNIGYWHPGLHPLRPRNYDERLPYPGTGEAEWRGLLPRRKTPYVINPRQGFLMNWNNVPSAGWTSGDAESSERLSGAFHRSVFLRRLVKRVTRKPSYDASMAINHKIGTRAQQRPLFGRRLRKAQRGSKGKARAIFKELIAWDGSYHRADANRLVHPGVAIWEEFKDKGEAIALFGLRRRGPGKAARDLAGGTGSSHAFDISNGEAYALRTLGLRALRLAAERTFDDLAKKFGNTNPNSWREQRRMYEVEIQGAASVPDLPFFDRGTWEQSTALGP